MIQIKRPSHYYNKHGRYISTLTGPTVGMLMMDSGYTRELDRVMPGVREKKLEEMKPGPKNYYDMV